MWSLGAKGVVCKGGEDGFRVGAAVLRVAVPDYTALEWWGKSVGEEHHSLAVQFFLFRKRFPFELKSGQSGSLHYALRNLCGGGGNLAYDVRVTYGHSGRRWC